MTSKLEEDKPIARQVSEGSKTPRYREAEQLFNQRFAISLACHKTLLLGSNDHTLGHSAVGHSASA